MEGIIGNIGIGNTITLVILVSNDAKRQMVEKGVAK